MPSAAPRGARPVDRLLPDPVGLTQPEAPTLERECDGHHVPSPVDLADAERIGHPHTGVEGRVGALAAHGVDGVDLDPRRVERDQEHGEAAMLRDVGIRAREQEHVCGLVRQRGEHLLPVDDPVVAVAHRPRLRRRDVGAGVGLGVPEGEDDLAGKEGREERLLLLLGADGADGAAHDDRLPEPIGGDTGEAQLVAHRRHLERVTPLPAVLLGPGCRDPALRAERPVEVPHVRGPGVVGPFDHLGPEVLAQELAHLLPEGVAALAEPELHQRPSTGPKSASARCSAPRRGSPRRSGHALARRW